MSFSPSPQFSKRWQATPADIKEVFYQELDDINDMLRGTTPAREFKFTYENFGYTLSELFLLHKNDMPKPARLIHNLENSSTLFEQSNEPTMERLHPDDLAKLEERISQKLQGQIDDFLGEHMIQVSEDLKVWLKTAIKNELAQYK